MTVSRSSIATSTASLRRFSLSPVWKIDEFLSLLHFYIQLFFFSFFYFSLFALLYSPRDEVRLRQSARISSIPCLQNGNVSWIVKITYIFYTSLVKVLIILSEILFTKIHYDKCLLHALLNCSYLEPFFEKRFSKKIRHFFTDLHRNFTGRTCDFNRPVYQLDRSGRIF